MSEHTHYEAEIHELHDFFAAWFNGSLPEDDATFARFADVLAEGFTIIGPGGGEPVSRDDILAQVRGGYGRRSAIRIWIEDVRLLHQIGDTLVVSYIEKQAAGDQETARRSTAVFVPASDAPNGLAWAHVHETWIAGDRST